MSEMISFGGGILKPGNGFERLKDFFLLQAEDGIRDATVTGVQTCALPIWKVLPRIETWYPDFLDEMRGYSKGSGVAFDVLAASWSGYSPSLGRKGCTDLAVGPEHTVDGSVLVAHNEDYSPPFDGNVVPVHVAVDGKPAFFAMSYGGLFPTIGFNDAGISLTGNAEIGRAH